MKNIIWYDCDKIATWCIGPDDNLNFSKCYYLITNLIKQHGFIDSLSINKCISTFCEQFVNEIVCIIRKKSSMSYTYVNFPYSESFKQLKFERFTDSFIEQINLQIIDFEDNLQTTVNTLYMTKHDDNRKYIIDIYNHWIDNIKINLDKLHEDEESNKVRKLLIDEICILESTIEKLNLMIE